MMDPFVSPIRAVAGAAAPPVVLVIPPGASIQQSVSSLVVGNTYALTAVAASRIGDARAEMQASMSATQTVLPSVMVPYASMRVGPIEFVAVAGGNSLRIHNTSTADRGGPLLLSSVCLRAV
jgi:hypothetical protein